MPLGPDRLENGFNGRQEEGRLVLVAGTALQANRSLDRKVADPQLTFDLTRERVIAMAAAGAAEARRELRHLYGRAGEPPRGIAQLVARHIQRDERFVIDDHAVPARN